MTFEEWVAKAEKRPLANSEPHYYFRASTGSRSTRFIKRDLKYFDAGAKDSDLFIVDETKQRVRHALPRHGTNGLRARLV